jgi:hypothetical protein
MPTNRSTIDRPRRTATIPPEAVELFRKLDATPSRQRKSAEFRAQDKALHQALGLWGDRICAAYGLLDCDPPKATGFVHSPPTLEKQQQIYAVRLALLDAVKETAPVGTDAA